MSLYQGNVLLTPPMSGGGVEQVPVDWNQNDSSAVDYVKNRTHYIETYTNDFFGTQTLNYDERLINHDLATTHNVWKISDYFPEYYEDTIVATLNIRFDEEEYRIKGREYHPEVEEGWTYCGIWGDQYLIDYNVDSYGGVDTDYPFALLYHNVGSNSAVYVVTPRFDTSNHTIEIFDIHEIYHQLNRKFMPERYESMEHHLENETQHVGWELRNYWNSKMDQADWSANEGESGYIENRTHYVGQKLNIVLEPTTKTQIGGFGTDETIIEPLIIQDKEYEVTVDGIPYRSVAYYDNGVAETRLGNSRLIDDQEANVDHPEDVPYLIYQFVDYGGLTSESYSIWIYYPEGEIHTTSIAEVTNELEYHTLDENYLPYKTETWTFTLADGTTVEKEIVLK